MTDMPTTTQMLDVLDRWRLTTEHGDARALRSAGAAMADILDQVATAQREAEERSAVRTETYDSYGRPKRASLRAQAFGVQVIHKNGWIVAVFPNGGIVRAMSIQKARETNEGLTQASRSQREFFGGYVVAITPGAAPGTRPNAQRGEHIADVLNRWADMKEAARDGRL